MTICIGFTSPQNFSRRPAISSALLICFCIALAGCDSAVDVDIGTSLGLVRGYESGGVQRFLGIPYAEPPVGERRWSPPLPKEPWDDVLLAKEFGPWCAQMDFDRRDEGKIYSAEGWSIFLDVPADEESSEDCLTLNVFAPAREEPKPVVVFFHGNGLGTSFPMYDGTAMARSGVVFVSVNYRLLSMGIFAHPALTRAAPADQPLGRYSAMDRLEALRWVQRNISAFGGDPNQVTVMGSSEGGAAILQMLGNPEAAGLFHRAIVQSGNGWWEPLTHEEHEQLGCVLATAAGLNGCDATVEELRELSWQRFPVTGPYTIDGRQHTAGATAAMEAGNVIDVPLLIGWNDFDGSSLRYTAQEVIEHTHPEVLRQYEKNASPEDLAYEIYTDLHAGAPARWVAHQMEDDKPVYLYLFSYVASWDEGDVRGAEHAYELPHVLNTWSLTLDDMFPFLSRFLLKDKDKAMSNIMHECWISFIKTGKPSCPRAPNWPEYNRDDDQVMELTLSPRILTGYRAQQLDAQEAHRSHYFQRVRESIGEILREGL